MRSALLGRKLAPADASRAFGMLEQLFYTDNETIQSISPVVPNRTAEEIVKLVAPQLPHASPKEILRRLQAHTGRLPRRTRITVKRLVRAGQAL